MYITSSLHDVCEVTCAVPDVCLTCGLLGELAELHSSDAAPFRVPFSIDAIQMFLNAAAHQEIENENTSVILQAIEVRIIATRCFGVRVQLQCWSLSPPAAAWQPLTTETLHRVCSLHASFTASNVFGTLTVAHTASCKEGSKTNTNTPHSAAGVVLESPPGTSGRQFVWLGLPMHSSGLHDYHLQAITQRHRSSSACSAAERAGTATPAGLIAARRGCADCALRTARRHARVPCVAAAAAATDTAHGRGTWLLWGSCHRVAFHVRR